MGGSVRRVEPGPWLGSNRTRHPDREPLPATNETPPGCSAPSGFAALVGWSAAAVDHRASEDDGVTVLNSPIHLDCRHFVSDSEKGWTPPAGKRRHLPGRLGLKIRCAAKMLVGVACAFTIVSKRRLDYAGGF